MVVLIQKRTGKQMKDSCCEIDNAAYYQGKTEPEENCTYGISQSQHSCCDIKVGEDTAICKKCGGKWRPVSEVTLKSLVKEPVLESIESLNGFYYCETPTCGVVYFNHEQQVYLHKEEVKIRVGIKEIKDPIPVCYCFGWTQERIFEQIKQLGYSTAIQEINAKVKAGECTCEIKNPSGRCCLGEVIKVVKGGLKLYSHHGE